MLYLLSLLSIPVAVFISYRSKEEMPTGMKFFPWVSICLLMAFVSAASVGLGAAAAAVQTLVSGVAAYLLKSFRPILSYLVMGAVSALSADPLLISLAFMYGLSEGSVTAASMMEKKGFLRIALAASISVAAYFLTGGILQLAR